MQLSYNKFKQIVDRSAERLFDKITEAVATSDNAALVALFDDKLILLDEGTGKLHLCDYTMENGILAMHNFQPVELTENDSTYLDETIDRYFDLDDESEIAVGDLMNGFRLKYKNESKNIFTEAKDRKYRKVIESARIGAIKKARAARDTFAEDIKSLLEEPFMKHLSMKVSNAQDSIPTALNKVTFQNPYPVKVNTDLGGPANELLKLRDSTNAMEAMKGVALRVSEKWKSESFRKKFEQMVNQILATESVELARTAVLSFLDENKELFLLKEALFDELITKTTLMLGEGNSESVLDIFHNILASKRGRMMKVTYFRENKLDEEKLELINSVNEQEEELAPAEKPEKKEGNDLDEEGLNSLIKIFKKIKGQMEEDSKEADYVGGLLSSLESVKTSGIEDSKMKDVIDFLNAAGSTKETEGEVEEEEPEEEEEVEL